MPRRKNSNNSRFPKQNNSGLLRNTSGQNLKSLSKLEKKAPTKKRLKLCPDESIKGLINRHFSKRRENSLDSHARDYYDVVDENTNLLTRGDHLGREKKRAAGSLESQSKKEDLHPKLNLPIFSKKRDEFSPDFSAGSEKKTFTQQTTLTMNHKTHLLTDEKKPANKGITQRLNELFSRIEKEEGEPEEISKLKKEIADSFLISADGPKTLLHYYKILKLLGKGSFGKVYMASQVLTNRVVAIKCLDKKAVREESRKNKIMHELLMFKTLAGHPNVIQIYEVFENKKYFFFVMEYASGGDLLQLMKKKSRLTEAAARSIFLQLLRGLRFIHSKKILHRDIKLDNVLLTEFEGELKAKICDFGVSRLVNEGETINEQCGTPAYIAPEIIKKKGYTGFAADVWSLGVLLYAMVMGAMPFKSNNIEGLHQKIKDRDCDLSDDAVSCEAKDLIERMLTVEPEQRISLEAVASHAWTREDPKQLQSADLGKDLLAVPEDIVLQKLLRFGFPSEHVKHSIRNYCLNHAFACYMSLAKDFE